VIRERLCPEDGFAPVSGGALAGWGLAYALFLLYAAANSTGFLVLDFANLMFHEAGHFFFSWAGYYTQILGGTLGQLLVPLLCLLVFIRRGETTAVAFSAFWCSENLLYIATYMGDARTSALPLVGSEESDWTILFSHWGVLIHDRTIAGWTRAIGWVGMLASVAWLVWMGLRQVRGSAERGR
jgi:hypothetical protein